MADNKQNDKEKPAKEKKAKLKKPGFFKGVKSEMKKVTWYSKADTTKSTVAP